MNRLLLSDVDWLAEKGCSSNASSGEKAGASALLAASFQLTLGWHSCRFLTTKIVVDFLFLNFSLPNSRLCKCVPRTSGAEPQEMSLEDIVAQ